MNQRKEHEAGYCVICGCHSSFRFDPTIITPQLQKAWGISDSFADAFNRKESMFCSNCGGSLRIRRLAAVLIQTFSDICGKSCKSFVELLREGEFQRLRIGEINACGALHSYLKQHANLCYSEWIPDVKPGEVREGIRCEDLQCLTYPDHYFDIILTSETLEHIPDPNMAWREIYRTLKSGGYHIFTIPVLPSQLHTIQRARLVNGRREDLLEPAYHGDWGQEGMFVYTEFGMDVVEKLSDIGLKTEVFYRKPNNELDVAVVFRSYKAEGHSEVRAKGPSPLLEWTGERYVPWMEGAEIGYEHIHRYAFASQFVQNKKVLDLACGEGYGSHFLGRTANHVVGIDIDEKTIKHAKNKYIKENIEFRVGSITEVPLEGQNFFDVIVCFEAIEHIEDHDALLKEVKRLLTSDGLFIVSTPNKWAYSDQPHYDNPFHVHELYFDEFRELLDRSFKRVKFLGQRIYCNSNIWPVFPSGNPNFVDYVIERNPQEFAFVEGDKRIPLYFIALASDGGHELSENASILVDSSNQLLKQKDVAVSSLAAERDATERMVKTQQQTLDEKERQLNELTADRDQLTQEIRQLQNTVKDQQDTISKGEQKISTPVMEKERGLSQKTEFDREVNQLQMTLAENVQLRAKIQSQQADLDQKREALAIIETSLGWKAITTYRQVKDKLLPIHTRRRGVYDRILARVKGFTRNLTREASMLILEDTGGERKSETSTIPRLPRIRKFRVIFLVGCVEFDSKRYRVSNMIEALNLGAVEADFFHDTDISTNLSYVFSHDIIILFRVGWTENIAALIRQAELERLPIVFDVDDYIFDPAIIPHVDGIRGWSVDAVKEYEQGVLEYKKTLEHCSYFTAPTLFLKNQAAKLGKKAYLIPNTINTKQVQICEKAIQQRKKRARSDEVVIGYFSGTLTHQKDFSVAYSALLRILAEFDHVRIKIGGLLDLTEFPDLRQFGERLQCVPFVHWERLPHLIADIDINIIPLEVGNPFCDAKSELKYFESGVLKIPSVASATETFKEAIRHGENGLLASSAEDWYGSLKSLILDEELRLQIGRNAYEDSVARYTTLQLTGLIKNTYKDILSDIRKRDGFDDNAISISFIVPLPLKGSGGHKDIFLLANHLKELGNNVVLFFTPGENFSSVDKLRDFIHAEFCDPKFDIVIGVSVSPCDALIATHYSTAYLVRQNAAMAARTFYFVQDYEPSFHPMGEEFISAEQTYAFGFQCITLGTWLKGVLERKYGIECRSIPFWIEKDIYYPQSLERKQRIAFFARPEMPRRCFNLGLQSLRLFHDRHPEIEIILFGSENIKYQFIPFKCTILDILSKSSLAELYSQISAGLVFSTTNPSFVAYEMMACECPVVDVQLNQDYDYLKYGSSENVVLVEPEPAKIAGALERLLRDQMLRATIAKNGLKFVESFPDIGAAASEFETILKDCLDDHDGGVQERFGQTNGMFPKHADVTHCPSCASLQRIQGREMAEFVDGERRSVIRCDRCGFLFLFPRLPEAEIERLEDSSEFKVMVNPQESIDISHQIAQFVESFKPTKGSCLEIGSGNGYLLKALQLRGWNVLGVEISGAAVRNASELGVEVFQGTLEEIKLPLYAFDAIILWHLLEHVYAPKDFLCKLRDLIKMDGLLFVQVPNFDKLEEYRKVNREKELLCAIHVNYFTVESLTNLATTAGWSMHSSYLDEKKHYIAAVLQPKYENATDSRTRGFSSEHLVASN